MKRLLTLAVLGALAAFAATSFAQGTAPAPATKAAPAPAAAPAAAPAMAAEPAANSQQNKMKTCQAEAGDKKLEGKARQDYVNKCLKAAPPKPKSKMAMCNEKTKGMVKADADKTRSECMKS